MLSVSTVHSLFVKQPSSENNNAAWSKSVPTSYIHKLLEHFWDLPGDLDGKESACSGGNRGSTTGLGISPGVGNGNPLQYSCLENPMDRGAWQAAVHGVARVRYNLVTKPPPQSAKKIPILKEAWVLILDLSPETKKQTFLVQILNLPFSICAILGKLFKLSLC